jgi:nucleotide-binding universal stress UspA family protein
MRALSIPAKSRAIAACSRKRRRNLVVVGSRHRGLIKRLLFGSVSAELVVEAPCDVLVVR